MQKKKEPGKWWKEQARGGEKVWVDGEGCGGKAE